MDINFSGSNGNFTVLQIKSAAYKLVGVLSLYFVYSLEFPSRSSPPPTYSSFVFVSTVSLILPTDKIEETYDQGGSDDESSEKWEVREEFKVKTLPKHHIELLVNTFCFKYFGVFVKVHYKGWMYTMFRLSSVKQDIEPNSVLRG